MKSIGVCFRFDASPSVGRGHVQRCAALSAAFSARGVGIRQAICLGDAGMLNAEAAAVFPDIVYMNEALAKPSIPRRLVDGRRARRSGLQRLDDSVAIVDPPSVAGVEGFARSSNGDDHDVETDACQVVNICREQQADLLVLDSYRVNEVYQQILLQHKIRWLQFDSFGRQNFYADWVLNASPGADERQYAGLRRRDNTRFLLGPDYAVLHARFGHAHGRIRKRTAVSRVAICLGGGNDGGATLRVLDSLRDVIGLAQGWDVIVGGSNETLDRIRRLLCTPPFSSNVSLHVDTPDVAALFASADLAVLTAGTVSYEAAALGLPMILVTIADNQAMNADGWSRTGAAITCGPVNAGFRPDRLRDIVGKLAADATRLEAMSRAASGQIDGMGAMRVADAMCERSAT